MSIPILLGFTGLCLLLAITPGPDTFLVLRYGLGGARLGIAAAIGSGIGSLWWAAMVALGLAALLQNSASAFLLVKVAGGLYLLYLGIAGFLRRGRGNADSADSGAGVTGAAGLPSIRSALWSGLFSCALNPKVGLFFLAVVPQFLPAHAIGIGPTMVLGAIDGVVAVFWLTLVAVGSATAVGWLRRPKVSRRLEEISSGILVALGIGTLASTA
ncbi:LysE family translocator [Nocardia sp. 004]|uniref:LysE family translocator n=1 Tax=Nocardia sp. 004 TaxID=3385978 RepID=UPI0039A1CA61